MAHAKAVLLINNDQAQVFEFHAFLDQFMRSNDDVYLSPFGQPCQGLGLFPG